MKNVTHILLIGSLIVVHSLTLSAMTEDSIVIAVHDYIPYYDSQGNGMVSELYRAAGKAAGMKVEIRVLPVKRGIGYLLDNKVDAFSPGHIFMNPDQVKVCSDYKAFNVVTIFAYYDPTKTKKVIFNSIADLKGQRVGLIVGSPLRVLFDQNGLPYEEVQTPDGLIKMLYAGRFDFIEQTFLNGILLAHGLYGDKIDYFKYVINFPVACGISFHHGNPKADTLRPRFIEGFETIKKNGTYIRILEKYWGKGNIQKEALPEDLARFGVDKTDLKSFLSHHRTSWGEIK